MIVVAWLLSYNGLMARHMPSYTPVAGAADREVCQSCRRVVVVRSDHCHSCNGCVRQVVPTVFLTTLWACVSLRPALDGSNSSYRWFL